jgi:hydrogenase maturation protease
MKTLVLGIGNDILGDDGVGISIAREVARRISIADVAVEETGAAGLSILELIRGYDRLIIADAILMEGNEVGKIHRLTLKDLAKTNDSITLHDAALRATLEIGNSLFPGEIPTDVVVYCVQTLDTQNVTDEMTRAVKVSVSRIVHLIISEIEGKNTNRS